MNRIVLSCKLKNKLLSSETLSKLATKGINGIGEYEKAIIDHINLANKKLKIVSIIYEETKYDTYIGIIRNEENLVIAYLSIIPPNLRTRSGFLSQQTFGFISNLIKEHLDTPCFEIINRPLYIVNSDTEDIVLSKAINIVGAQILGFTYIDLYNRNIIPILETKTDKPQFNTLEEFNTLMDDTPIFSINKKNIYFKTTQLKSLEQTLTNEPYYFAMKAYPALYLASMEDYKIDISSFKTWYNSGKNLNKNVEAFYLYAEKLSKNTANMMQKIFYGAPGTGKSFKIDNVLKTKGISNDYIFRVTFHPEYTYSDFIGQLLPTVEGEGRDRQIKYSFSKGIFTQAIEKAYEDISKEVYLILEEISRGDVAAILGDVFQLLDREFKGPYKGYSRYFINNDIIAKDILTIRDNKVKLPPNLFILGTVNTSDQNVFVMDTAFKRRFDWEYVSTKPVKDDLSGSYLNNPSIKIAKPDSLISTYSWIDFYTKLNVFISHRNYLELGEDKQIGPFFIQFENDAPSEIKEKIKNKLLQYLWNDIQKATFKRNVSLFSDDISCFSDLYDMFEEEKCIFSTSFLNFLDNL